MDHGAFDGEVELMRATARRSGPTCAGAPWCRATAPRHDLDHRGRDRGARTARAAGLDRQPRLAHRPDQPRRLRAALEQATAASRRQPFCALFIDLDRFKQVNDTGGHAAGDALLRDVAQLLAAQVRKSDTVARLGGDEFAVLLNSCPLAQAQLMAEKMRSAVVDYRLTWEGDLAFSVGASIGLLPVAGTYSGAAEVLRAADAACYAAKRQGRNCVVVATADAPLPAAQMAAAAPLAVAAPVEPPARQVESLSAD